MRKINYDAEEYTFIKYIFFKCLSTGVLSPSRDDNIWLVI